MLKLFIGFAFLSAVFANEEQTIDDDDCTSAETFNEIPCLSDGGICVVPGDCPEGQLSKVSGLCPLQQPQGIECCYGLPKSEKRCRCRGGECVPKCNRCPENLTFREATDCGPDEKCCILVN